MSPAATRRLLSIHRWCGVLVSANLLVLALTGLILIFHDEIDAALGVVPPARSGSAEISLAQSIELARKERPSALPVFLFQDPSEHPGFVFVGLSEGSRRLDDAKPVSVDRRAARVVPGVDFDGSFTGVILKIHAELYAGPIGRLLVGVVALALLVSLISGGIVYGPMMRRFAFGLLRRDGARRTLLADLHKLLGIATLGWTVVVAATGFLLSIGSILLQLYSATELARLGASAAGEPVVTALASIDRAVDNAEHAALGRRWSVVALPGSDLASPRHYSVLLQGGAGVESKLLTLARVDAIEPAQVDVHELPLYLKALLVSEPLHFGDYGGLPLKILWALFGSATLVLGGSGLAVFLGARRDRSARSRSAPLDTTSATEVPPSLEEAARG